MRARLHLLGLFGIFGILGLPVGWWLDWIFTDRRPPIVAFESVEALNSPVTAGGDLVVRILREKIRDDCEVTSLRTAMDRDGRIWPVPHAVSQEGGDADAAYVDWAYPIPETTPPGQYVLRVHLIYDCEGTVWHYDQPETLFQVE